MIVIDTAIYHSRRHYHTCHVTSENIKAQSLIMQCHLTRMDQLNYI